MNETYSPAAERYDTMTYNYCGKSGLKLPGISLGLWHNFGQITPFETQRALCQTAFNLGITHFDLANNYGPPYGEAERNFGQILKRDFSGTLRDELVISTKAGYEMWPGPYGEWGSKKTLVASLNQSLTRMGLNYVDIFYHHRPDPNTPLEETMGALDLIVRQGKALYVGISNYSAEDTAKAAAILQRLGTPFIIHQVRYSMFARGPEEALLDTLDQNGLGCIVFSPLAQGLLTGKYANGIPKDSRMSTDGRYLKDTSVTPQMVQQVQKLNEIAQNRGQSLTQMALSWVLRRPTVTSALIGASRPQQIAENIGALEKTTFAPDELAAIDAILA
ncbi:L-glyceraldehyde 3-phosphate reductase [Ruminococcaceae bacterium OttesenSCG-928-A16]|nr:L-glyceraldehyde 3-phosphate reductase [Ruminococcaceae bacterium OttesenSCG-928-A16]